MFIVVANIKALLEVTGGFGTVIGFVHDWANPEATRRSWDLVARHVIPEINGYLAAYRSSQKHVIEHRDSFDRAGQAVLNKIQENERALKAFREGANAQTAIPAHHAPDRPR